MTHAASTASTPDSAWVSLRHPAFRAVWIATIASNVGTWLQDVGNAWLMTSLSPSPLMVSLVQAAGSLPLFLLALPAGAMADVLDRRRLLIVSQLWMCAAAVGIGIITLVGLAGPWTLLLFAVLLGVGSALAAPAFQSVVPELVPPEDLAGAVGLNALAVNLSRSVGPALGGLLVAAAGPGVAFLLNAVSFALVAVVFYRWRREVVAATLPSERVVAGMRAGWRYVLHHPPLRAVLIRNAAFMIGASAMWALLPVVVRGEMHLGPAPYGLLLGCMGIGALAAISVLPRVRKRVSVDALVIAATALFAGASVGTAYIRSPFVLVPFLFIGGIGWVTTLGVLNVAAQKAVPAWVRSRALAAYLLVWFGSMTLGSVVWGLLASQFGSNVALVSGGAVMLLAAPIGFLFPLKGVDSQDLSPARAWPEPAVSYAIEPDRGPVLVQIEYRVRPDAIANFVNTIRQLRGERLRDGAFSWGVYADTTEPTRFLESFAFETWLEHLRQHERVSRTDAEIQKALSMYLVERSVPRVTHHIAPSRMIFS